MLIDTDMVYVERVSNGQRIAGDVIYPDLAAAVEMGRLVSRIMAAAGEDPTDPRWTRTLREVNTTLSLLGAPWPSGVHQVPA